MFLLNNQIFCYLNDGKMQSGGFLTSLHPTNLKAQVCPVPHVFRTKNPVPHGLCTKTPAPHIFCTKIM